VLRALTVLLAVAAIALPLASPAAAQARARLEYGYPPPTFEAPPRSGIGAIAVGAGALGISLEQLLTIPLCYADWYPVEVFPCAVASATVAGVGLAVGLPSLLVGLRRRARYKAWRQRQHARVALGPVSFWGAANGGGLRVNLRF
jgi:hypothetical protein